MTLSDDFLYPPEDIQDLSAPDAAHKIQTTFDAIFAQLRKLSATATHDILSATHADTSVETAANGDILIRAGGVWARLAKGTNLHFLQLVAGLPAWGVNGSLLEDLNAAELVGTVPTASVVHNLLSAHHADTVAATPPEVGDVVVARAQDAVDSLKYWFDGGSLPVMSTSLDGQKFWFDGHAGDALAVTTPKWQRLAKGVAGQALVATASGVDWGAAGATSGAGDPVAVHAQQAGSVTLPQGTAITISFAAVTYDTSGFWSSGAPTRLTIPTGHSGLYVLTGQADITLAVSALLTLELYKNGVLIAEAEFSAPTTGGHQVAVVADLLAGDYIEMKARLAAAGADATVAGGSNATFLQATKALRSETVGELLPDPLRGVLLKGNAAATAYERLTIGSVDQVLISDGNDPLWSSRPTLEDLAESVTGVWEFVNGFKERGRTAKVMEWTTVSYAAGDFTASAGTWTVDSGDLLGFRYALSGKTMFVQFLIVTSDVSLATEKLKVRIPGGYTAAARFDNFGFAIDNGGTAEAATLTTAAGGTTIDCGLLDGTNWAATAADNTAITGEIFFEVQ